MEEILNRLKVLSEQLHIHFHLGFRNQHRNYAEKSTEELVKNKEIDIHTVRHHSQRRLKRFQVHHS